MKIHGNRTGRATLPERKTGFTMVEILVALAIIAVLAVICYKAGTSMIRRAWIIQSSANIKSLVIANATYQADNGEFCPADDQYNTRRWHGSRSSAGGKFDPTEGFLSPYLGKSRTVNICPIFKDLVEGGESFESGTGGYGYNSSYIGGLPGGKYNRTTKIRVPEKMVNVQDPSRTVMFTTTAYARASGLQEYPFCEPPFWDFGSGPSGQRPSPTVHFRAEGKAIVAWCDGHVSTESKREATPGENPHGGDSENFDLGWFGPDEENGYWNPRRQY